MMVLQTFEEAVAINNEVGQGLSSSLFTNNPELTFRWIGLVANTRILPKMIIKLILELLGRTAALST